MCTFCSPSGPLCTFNQPLNCPTIEGAPHPLDDEGRYNCKGIIDRLMLAPDGAFEIHDYKTGSSLPDEAELDDSLSRS